MKNIALSIALFLFTALVGEAQTKYSTNNYRGNWIDGASWSREGNFENNIAPLTTDLMGYSIGIQGYITRYGDIDLGNDGNKSSRTFTIRDTLVITGNLQLDNEAMDMVVPEKGLLIIFGNFNATNKITVMNGGTVIVKGTMSFSNSGHDDYSNTVTGNLYTGHEPTGNLAAAAANKELSALPSGLYDFIMQDPTDGDMFQLPVELLYFTASAAPKGIQLEWAAAREWNFSHYTLERSDDGKDFMEIHREDAGASSQINQKYTYLDPQPHYGANYYRLRTTDIDGAEEIKSMALAYAGMSGNLVIGPNPVQGQLITIQYAGAMEGTWLSIHTISGLELMRIQMHEKELRLPASVFTPGVYLVIVENALETKQTRLVVH